MTSVALRPVHGLALCAGGAGLELGVRLALGPGYRTVAHVERDPFAAAVLVARMADQALDQAPVWDDLRTFDGRPWRGTVDLLTAGFPCQPFSAAGQRRGLDDDRWLWPHIARVVREVEPGVVFVENVRGFLAEHGGLGAVLGDLADLGFDAEWEVLSAEAVGASHRRERFWLLAYRDDLGREGFRWEPGHNGDAWDDADGRCGAPVADGPSEPGRSARLARPAHDLADTIGEQRERGRGPGDVARSGGRAQGEARERERCGDAAGDRREDVAHPDDGRSPIGSRPAHRARNGVEPANATGCLADADGSRCEGQRAEPTRPQLADARGGRCHLPLWPPGPDDPAGWIEVLRTQADLEPAVHRMADGLAHRVERSHLIGNGVVPLVAATALVRLARRAGLHTAERSLTTEVAS